MGGTRRRGAQPGADNHQWKGGRTVASNGYVLVKEPAHPCADSRGYVYEHRLIAEQVLGRQLAAGEIVHHRNGVRADNRPDNLEVVSGVAQHRLEHRSPGSRLRKPGTLNQTVSCACGCGAALHEYDRFGRPRRFVSGHNLRRREWPPG